MLTMIEQEPHFLNQRTPPTATIAIVPISDHAAAPKHGQLAYFNTLKISHKNEGSLEGCAPIEAFHMRIPTQGGQVFRHEGGHPTDLKAATIPT